MSILQANTAAPLQLAELFAPYMCLLQLDPVEHAQSFAAAAGGVDSPDLERFGAEVERLQAAAQAVRLLCTDSVRAGNAEQLVTAGCGTRLLA